MNPSHSRHAWLLPTIAFALTVLAYWPSLHGGYEFDDFPNIVQNPDVHMTTLDATSLRKAALASPSSVLVRPLAMLSFAIDWYFTGADPLPMRVVNLVIHLLNGLLLFGLLRTLCRCLPPRRDNAHLREGWLPAVVAAAWLLAPINFTAVAYIVQRMESLCQVFVLAGLWGYLAARRRMLAGESGFAHAVAAIVLGTAIGGLVKESAVLLPLYALIAEWALFGFARHDGKIDRRIFALYLVLLALPACAALYWIAGHALPASAWGNRPFTLGERLLTEPRILWDYVHWSLLPMANQLALYHDHIKVSHGLLDPWTTLAGIIGLCALAAIGFVLRRTRPLVAIGVLWFLAAHLLTATVIPLELAFEHRNYFASIGLYLAVFSWLLPAPGAWLALARSVLCLLVPAFFASVTFVRALNWGNPILFALSEAQLNPDSPRTAYELARTYVELSGYRADSPLIPKAYAALERAASLPGADVLPDQGLLILSGRLHQQPPAGVWERLRQRMAGQPLSAQNISALFTLNQCVLEGHCDFPAQQMVQTFLAALEHQPPNNNVLSIYASYAMNALHDAALATDLARTSVRQAPRDLRMRRNLLLILAASGQHEAAKEFYEQTLRELPRAGNDPAFRAALDTPPATIVPVPGAQ
jgi:tetratricopeptide (TPR) repeat protein